MKRRKVKGNGESKRCTGYYYSVEFVARMATNLFGILLLFSLLFFVL